MRQGGFTLVESLLVLSIFLILTSVTALSLRPQNLFLSDHTFITQLQADLLYGQQFAISHQCEVFFKLTENSEYTIYYRFDRPPLVTRPYSSEVQFYPGTLPLSFKFLSDGNISQFGSFSIKTCCKQYRITFLIGKGRFYVSEE
jgi:competence protein ComGD